MGTDALGRSVLNLTVWGTRISMVIGLLATIITVVLGALDRDRRRASSAAGSTSVLMRITDLFLVLPTFVLALILAPIILEIVGRDAEIAGIRITLIVIVIVIGITSWASTARVIRSQVLSLKERAFVDRARVIGAGGGHIMRRHLLPNVINLIIANTVLIFAGRRPDRDDARVHRPRRPVPAVVGPDPQRRRDGRRAGPRGVVVGRPAGRLHRPRGAGVHARRQRPRRHPQPARQGRR